MTPNLLLFISFLSLVIAQQYGQYNPQYPDQYNRQGQANSQGQYYPQGGQGQNQGQYTPPNGQYDRDPQNRWQYGNQGPYNVNQPNQNQYGQQYPQQGQYPQQFDNRNRGQYDNDGNRRYDAQSNYGQPVFAAGRDDNCCEEYCYKQDENPHLYFGSKTAYTFVFGKRIKDHVIPYCRAIQFWSINRHGTRFPNREKMEKLRQLQRIHDEFVRNYEERRSYPDKGRMCNEDFELLKMWRWNDTVNPEMANALTSQGVDDVKFLARRTQTRFPNILGVPYSDTNYYFRYTDTERTHDSYQAYIEGLFGNNAYQVRANIQMDDPLARPDQTCTAFRQHLYDNPEVYSELRQFKEGKEYKELVRNVFRRLGFRYILNASVVEDIYDMCRFEKAWYVNRHSPWCAAFTKEQLKLLEYAADLEDYYYSGYGNDMARKIGCSPIKDLYERFSRTVSGDNSGQKAAIYFTHSTPFQAFLTALGIAKDSTPLRSDNYYQQQQRNWRTAKIAPFAANLAAVLYQCDQGEQYKVMFFLNEQPVDFPGCAVGLCSWENFKSQVQPLSENCNLDFCERGSSAVLRLSNLLLGVLLAALARL